MVAVRLDRRLAARVDPSDVVQEALAEADRRLDDYLRGPAAAVLPVAAAARLGAAGRRCTAGTSGPAGASVGREERGRSCRTSRRWNWPTGCSAARHQPERRPAPARSGGAGAGRPGPAAGARPRGAGAAAPGAAVDGARSRPCWASSEGAVKMRHAAGAASGCADLLGDSEEPA